MNIVERSLQVLIFGERHEIDNLPSSGERQNFIAILRDKSKIFSGDYVAMAVLKEEKETVVGLAKMTAVRIVSLGRVMPAEWAIHAGFRDKSLFAQHMAETQGCEINDQSIVYVERFRVLCLDKSALATLNKTS